MVKSLLSADVTRHPAPSTCSTRTSLRMRSNSARASVSFPSSSSGRRGGSDDDVDAACWGGRFRAAVVVLVVVVVGELSSSSASLTHEMRGPLLCLGERFDALPPPPPPSPVCAPPAAAPPPSASTSPSPSSFPSPPLVVVLRSATIVLSLPLRLRRPNDALNALPEFNESRCFVTASATALLSLLLLVVLSPTVALAERRHLSDADVREDDDAAAAAAGAAAARGLSSSSSSTIVLRARNNNNGRAILAVTVIYIDGKSEKVGYLL